MTVWASLHTTHWGLLSQPDKHKRSSRETRPYPLQTPAQLAGSICGTSDWRSTRGPPDPEMAHGGRHGTGSVAQDGGRQPARGGDITNPCQPLPTLRLGSVGGSMAEAAGARGCDHRAIRGRCRVGIRAPGGRGAVPGAVAGKAGKFRAGTTPGENAPD